NPLWPALIRASSVVGMDSRTDARLLTGGTTMRLRLRFWRRLIDWFRGILGGFRRIYARPGRKSSRPQRPLRTPIRRRRLLPIGIEQLEPRRMMTVTTTYDNSSGLLEFTQNAKWGYGGGVPAVVACDGNGHVLLDGIVVNDTSNHPIVAADVVSIHVITEG